MRIIYNLLNNLQEIREITKNIYFFLSCNSVFKSKHGMVSFILFKFSHIGGKYGSSKYNHGLFCCNTYCNRN